MDKTINVMVVDDHPIFRDGLKSYLIRNPNISQIHMASDGAEAIEMLKRNNIEIIFMDISMPNMNGIEATRLIKKDHKAVKIIGISMFDDHNSINGMLLAGASGYLSKMASYEEIMTAFKAIDEGHRYFSPEIMNDIYDSNAFRKTLLKQLHMIEPLTNKEAEIVNMILQGHTSNKMAENLNISVKTVEAHRTHIFDKLRIKHLIELFYYALDIGLIKRNQNKRIWISFLFVIGM